MEFSPNKFINIFINNISLKYFALYHIYKCVHCSVSLYGACNSPVKDFPCAAFNSYGNYSMCVCVLVCLFLMFGELSLSPFLSSTSLALPFLNYLNSLIAYNFHVYTHRWHAIIIDKKHTQYEIACVIFAFFTTTQRKISFALFLSICICCKSYCMSTVYFNLVMCNDQK